jgi:Ser/Thr protein kinase RdoA (MazF antagonist)
MLNNPRLYFRKGWFLKKRLDHPKTVPVMMSAPSSKYLSGWVRKTYGLKGKVHCSLWGNAVNLTYYVEDSEGKKSLRIYRPGMRTKGQIRFELKQLQFLEKSGIPVSTPLRDRKGDFQVPLRLPDGDTVAVLFTFADGAVKMRPAAWVGRELGALLARLHQSQDKFLFSPPRLPEDVEGLVDRPMASLEPYRSSFGKDWAWLGKATKKIKKELSVLPREKPFYGLIHGDAHFGNMHYSPARKTYVLFDFDHTILGWRLYDLATLLWDTDEWKKGELKQGAKALVRAYSAIRPLTNAELKALPAMMAARQLTWMGFQAGIAERWTIRMVSEENHHRKLQYLRRWMSGELKKDLGL